MSNRKMSKYVTEQMYVHSDTAIANKINNNFVTVGQFNVGCKLSQKILDCIFDFYRPKKGGLSSGFRGKGLNEKVGGDEHSDHCINISLGGAAADIYVLGVDPKTIFNDIFLGRILQPNGKPVKELIDQCIYEERHGKRGIERWVHVGRRDNPRHQFMYSLDGKTYHTATKIIK